jgi:sortase A
VNPRGPIAKAPRRTRSFALRAAYYVLLAGGFFGLGYAGYVIVDAHAYQAVEQSKFENISPSPSSGEEPHPLIEGGVIGEMEIQRLGMKAIFVQGDSPRTLRRAVGHISETALPGQQGNVVLTAHRYTFFRPLRNIQSGDAITIKTLDGEFEYQVESTDVVSPSDVQVLQPSSENTLTLITCYPFYYVGGAPKRFIVHARQIGQLPVDSSIAEAPPRF